MTSADRRERLARAGKWLRDQRQRRGIATAVEFARLLGVDKALVSNYERGMTAVSDERAEQIADALDMDLIEVRRNLGLWVPPEEREEPPDREEGTDLLTDEEIAIIDRIRSDPRKRARLVDAILAASGHPPRSTDTGENERPGHRKSG